MSKRDFWSKFYWGDWRKDSRLSRCSRAQKGAWMDFMAFVFELEEPGYAVDRGEPMTLQEIAQNMTGDQSEFVILLEQLVEQKIIKQDDRGAFYCKRMADEFNLREKRKAAGASGGRKTQDLLKQKLEQKVEQEVEQGSNSNSNCISSFNSDSESITKEKEDDLIFPLGADCLDTQAFRDKWADWLAYRTAKRYGKLAPITVKTQFLKLARVGHDRAIETIDQSIANDWKGLFPEKSAGKAGSGPKQQAEQRRADAAKRGYEEDENLTFD